MSKVCSKCGIEKSLELFNNNKATKDGKTTKCKECHNIQQRQYYIDNKESIDAKHKKYWSEHKEETRIHNAQYNRDHPEVARKSNRKVEARRRNWGNPEPINNDFPESHLHHLHVNDHTTCIHVPSELHNSIRHAWNKPKKMNEINKLITEWYLKTKEI